MAFKRENIGSFMKAKQLTADEIAAGKVQSPPYLKLTKDIVFKSGDFVRVENKQYQINSLEKAIASGKLSGESAQKMLERAKNIPDFVLGELVLLNNN